jgi:hypothetical protein
LDSRSHFLVRHLTGSDLGWFAAARDLGRARGNQRGINLNAELMKALFPESWLETGALRVRATRASTGAGDWRSIRRQEKNWRLVGPKVEGAGLEALDEGDFFWAWIEPVAEPEITWDILAKANAPDKHRLLATLVEDDLRGGLAFWSTQSPKLTAILELCGAGAPDSQKRSMTDSLAEIQELAQSVQPDPHRLLEALRAIGYTLEHAVADIIDNAIDARARNVLVQFHEAKGVVDQIVICDDGDGMSQDKLIEAMRFGSKDKKDPSSLGKYGLGLKLASFSQAETLTVITRRDGVTSGRRWTPEGIYDNWRLDAISPDEAARWINRRWGALRLDRNGTLVIWSRVDKLHRGGRCAESVEVDAVVAKSIRSLALHLGLYLHRIIEDGRIAIKLESDIEGEGTGLPKEVKAVNPFGHPSSGNPKYPKTYRFEIPDAAVLSLRAHIWPANSLDENFKLGGRANIRQGFYFYRNDRLIQAGGWNGLRDTEPHLTLARVAVDLPPGMDTLFSLDVKKSGVQPPPVWSDLPRLAVDDDREPFAQFLRDAQQTYRHAEAANPENHPLVPSNGLSAELRKRVREIVAPDTRRVREVEFRWSALESGSFFELDREDHVIVLNKAYRRKLLARSHGSAADAPVLKLLLFFLFAEDLTSARVSAAQKQRIDMIDQALRLALRDMADE